MSHWYVAIGASGGDGLDDIKEVLRNLPAPLNAVVLIVLHRLWDARSKLAEVLARSSQMPVKIARDGEKFEVGTVYVGEPADHLTLAKNSFGLLIDDPGRHHGNRTIDLLFRSVAAHGGIRMIGVILSGSLDDGSRGLAAIKAAGGLSMVLTPSAPPTKGMPENAINFDGPIDLIGNPITIAKGICQAVKHPSERTEQIRSAS